MRSRCCSSCAAWTVSGVAGPPGVPVVAHALADAARMSASTGREKRDMSDLGCLGGRARASAEPLLGDSNQFPGVRLGVPGEPSARFTSLTNAKTRYPQAKLPRAPPA